MLLDEGKVVEIGDTAEFFVKPRTEKAMEFIRTDEIE
jgi:ABC-type methionine transport system ATPase subunit